MALTWDERAGSFRNEKGQFVSPDTVRRVINDIADGASERMAALSRQMLAGELSLAEWQASSMRVIKHSQLAASTIAHGGAARMDFSRYGQAGNAIKAQYQYLAQFAEGIASGEIPLKDAAIIARARQYGQSSRITFEREYGRDQQQRGFQSCRNVLHPAEHCAVCVSESARGWVALGSLIPIGSRTCRGNDRCSISYRREPAEMAA